MRKFYVEILNIPLFEEKIDSFTLKVWNSKLEFKGGEKESFYHFAFTLPNNKLMEVQDWLSKRVNILKDEGEQIVVFSSPWNAKS